MEPTNKKVSKGMPMKKQLKVHLYEKEQEDGRVLRHIKFKFPVFFNGMETEELCWENESTVETVVLMSRVENQP